MLLYVEQPFPYDLEANPIDVRSVSAAQAAVHGRECATTGSIVRLGRSLGWSGVALKTCKTQSGRPAEPVLGQGPRHAADGPGPGQSDACPDRHVQLAAHAGTIMGVETNGSQFFRRPRAARPKSIPAFTPRGGQIDLSTIQGPGFGYNGAEDSRQLPPAVASVGELRLRLM